MINLPQWKLTLCPPLYDTASVSPTEQTAQVYGKMRELIEDYNSFTAEVSNTLNEYINKTNGDIDEFKKCITALTAEFIKSVDVKLVEMKAELTNLIIDYNENAEEIIIGGATE